MLDFTFAFSGVVKFLTEWFNFFYPFRFVTGTRPHPGGVPPGVKRVARGGGAKWGESDALNPAFDWFFRLG